MARPSLADRIERGGPVDVTDRQAVVVRQAAQLFDQRGYHQTSMEDIADAVGLSKPTLYHYFEGKSEILFWIHHEIIERLIAGQERLPPGQSATERLERTMGDILELMHTHRAYVRIFHSHRRELPAALMDRVRDRRNHYQSLVESVIADGIEAGEFAPVDVKMAAFGFLGMGNWTHRWYHPDGGRSHEEVAAFLVSLVVRGLEPREE